MQLNDELAGDIAKNLQSLALARAQNSFVYLVSSNEEEPSYIMFFCRSKRDDSFISRPFVSTCSIA